VLNHPAHSELANGFTRSRLSKVACGFRFFCKSSTTVVAYAGLPLRCQGPAAIGQNQPLVGLASSGTLFHVWGLPS
jgi:hypothetical protein